MSKPQRLDTLFDRIPVTPIAPESLPDIVVAGIRFNSQSVLPGDFFIAQIGRNSDGHRYIPMAIDRGAVAVAGTRSLEDLATEGISITVPYIQLSETRESLAYLSAAFYEFPAHSLRMIGVTGTDGKTTTSSLIYQILRASQIPAGVISTIYAEIGDETIDTGFHVTTPEAPYVQGYLSRMVESGLTHAVLETTSFGLSQHRVTACEFDIGVVTNITHEHLDVHGSYEAYRDAKAMLFQHLETTTKKEIGNPRLAVLNLDDESYSFLHALVTTRQIAYSQTSGKGDLWAEDIHSDGKGVRFTAVSDQLRLPIESQLPGLFNVSNCLAAIGATYFGLGIQPEYIQKGITAVGLVPGRMERIDMGQTFTAIVDFAHTPNALLNALQSVRKLTHGRVIAVFGSAGLRDRQKRRMMAEVSIQYADRTIMTAEDPRTESLDDILAEMKDAAEGSGGTENETYWTIPDRGDAIRLSMKLAKPGDLVVVCGKGHEQSMCFGVTEYPWDDRIAVKAALAELLGVPGPIMPVLPTKR